MLRRQRNVPLSEDEAPQRKASSGTVRSEGGLSQYSKSGIWHIHDSTDSLPSSHRGSMRSKRMSESSQESIRFPRLEDCAHFHYDYVDFGQLQVNLCDDDRENYRHNEAEQQGEVNLLVRVSVGEKGWTVRRSLAHFASLDRQLHRCIFDRKFSQLPDVQTANTDVKTSQEVAQLLQSYLRRFTELAGTMINCGSILNWLEMDNRGNRLLAMDDSGINTPAIAAAHAVKRYTAQAADEISLQVGDIVSVIDMPPVEDTIWWRGKRGFEVGFFPSACVEVIIGDKVPSSMATVMPATGSLSTSMHAGTLTPMSTPAVTRKPCEVYDETASMLRRHGKLMSVLRTFFTNRPPRNQLKQSGIVKERVFGCDLGEHLLNSGHDVPVVLKSCAEVIERHGIVDGIYRLSGITSNIQKLRVAFDEDEVPEVMEATYLQDIHSISSLLKMYFRELPNPLLTYQLYDKFAEAVRDEDNKLLRIHDVVQQLPPPHYRTLEYLMRHLGRVASHALETGMHSKNLAIVWAPNLLRSKELELGGGAAALQGVGIQAVVTECLICYCDLIFNDKMPAYNSPHMNKSQKKPRPKSLAISTPTRLLSLEEARERAFLTSLAHSQRFIDVGGGPSSLPPNYHTVIDLPGKKSGKPSANKGKKSPVSAGWKSIFSKPRSGSIKKPRKGSIQGDEKPLESLKAKALTEEDVHNWKHRLRSAKSAESLLSMATSARSSICSQSSSSMGGGFGHDGSRQREELLSPYHKRSLSSDASMILHPRYHTSPHLELLPLSPGQMPGLGLSTAVNLIPIGSLQSRGASIRPPQPSSTTMDQSPQLHHKQVFIRGDSTRKALHRRTPSAPSTPRQQDRTPHHTGGGSRSAVSSPSKASSQPQLDSLSGSPNSDSSSLLMTPPSDSSLGIDIDAAIKARLQQMALQSRGGVRASLRSPEKAASETGEAEKVEERNGSVGGEFVSSFSPSNPVQKEKKVTQPAERTKFFVSRYHDYAEIVSSSDEEGREGEEEDEEEDDEGMCSPPTDMQEVMDKWDSKLASTAAHFYLPPEREDPAVPPEAKHAKLDPPSPQKKADNLKDSQAVQRRSRERIQSNQNSFDSPPSSTQVVRRRVEIIPSDDGSSVVVDPSGKISGAQFLEVSTVPVDSSHGRPPQVPRNQRSHPVIGAGGSVDQKGNMWKCLSVPSDIAQSLENITASHTELLSSVTLSELSQSVNSFSTPACSSQDPASTSPHRDDPRWRRSASLDSLEGESTLGRTLRDINAQIDTAFHKKVDRALQLEEEGYSRHGDSDSSSLTPLHISEDNLSPTHRHQDDYLSDADVGDYASLVGQDSFPRSVSDSRSLGSEVLEPSMSQSYPVPGQNVLPRNNASRVNSHPDYPDYAIIIRKRQKTSKEDRGPGFYSGQGILEDTVPEGVSPVSGQGGNYNFMMENAFPDSGQWSQGGEGYAPSPQMAQSSHHHTSRRDADPIWHSSRSPGCGQKSDPRCHLREGSRFDPNLPNSDSIPLSQAEISTGVCMVKRQEKSSSSSCSSTSSSDVEENIVDGIEIVHRVEPVGAQFAVKLNRKQRTATTSPSLSSPQSNRGSSLRIVSTSVSENKKLISEDIHWKQSPLFTEEGGENHCGGVKFRYNRHHDQLNTEGDRAVSEAFGAETFSSGTRYGGFSEESCRTFPPPHFHHHHSGEGFSPRQARGGGGSGESPPVRRLSQSSDHRETNSPRPVTREGRPRAASQSDSATKFQREELPIISGNLPSSPPPPSSLSQRSQLPSPRSPTICSPPSPAPGPSPSLHQSRLPSPRSPPSAMSMRSPVLSSPPHKSRLPSLNSPVGGAPPLVSSSSSPSPKMLHSPSLPQTLVSSSSAPSAGSALSPLHLMLYHPDEFQAPPAAVGVASPEAAFPQVYVKSDTVMEEKAIIRKAGTCRVVPNPEAIGGTGGQVWLPEDMVPVAAPRGGQQTVWKSLSPSSGVELRVSGALPSDHLMQLGKAEQDSMEVDNLCNRLVDELHSTGISSSRPTPSVPISRLDRPETMPLGSVQVEAVLERRVEESEVGGEAIVEERLLRVESFGDVGEEEVENALNTGKELLLSHSSSLTPSSSSSSSSITTTTTVLSSSPSPVRPSHERRPSASKIPRFHKRTDSREEKSFAVSEEDAPASPLPPVHRRMSSQEDRSLCSDTSLATDMVAQQSPRIQKQVSTSREEKTVVSDVVTQGKVSQYSRYHRQTNSREEKTVVPEVSQGGGVQPPRVHRRTSSHEEKNVLSLESQDIGQQQNPRFHRRTNSREDKTVPDVATDSYPSVSKAPNRSRGPERSRGGVNSKSKDSNDGNKSGSGPRTSKIPLSQKMPSPTGSGREPKISRTLTSPSSPRQATTPPSGKSQNKTQPSPVPRARTSVQKSSENITPPSEEVIEVARPSVKKRMPANQKGEKKGIATAKEARGEKNVLVQELKIDKGDAKLVIEKQPNLKKKIQTVHAQKVPHPTRQIAEALDTDTCDSSSPVEVSSTGPSDMEHSGLSSQEDEVFSDENLCLLRVVGRDRSFSSGMGGIDSSLHSPSRHQPPLFLSPMLNQTGSESYHHMAASRSSLDDSALQLAAERQDDLLESSVGRGSYCTGSLRTRRSQKMRNLVEMFERGSSSQSGEESTDTTKKRDRSGSTSTTLSAGSQDKGLDADDDMFHPPCTQIVLVPRRSRSRERGGAGGKISSPHKHPSQSPSRRYPTAATRSEEMLRRRRPSPAGNRGNNNTEDKIFGTNRTEGVVGFGRPPRYRSSSRGRVYSDSSTSESDNTVQLDTKRSVMVDFSMSPRPRGGTLPRVGPSRQDDSSGEKSEGSSRESVGGDHDDDGSQRRGSIKELRQLFEKSSKDESRDSGNELSPPVPPRRFVRTRSMSPATESSLPLITPNLMRHSMEIPPSSAMVKQPLRLGPKPFYGSKK